MSPRKKTTPATPAPPAAAGRSASRAPAASAPADGIDLTAVPLDAISLTGLDPRVLIAPNFRVYELTRSELANRRHIDNGFLNDGELRSAIHLARHVLQPVRDAFGAYTPNSVYRSQTLERALKNKPSTWISNSQHTRGEACDLEIVGMPTLELAIWARDHLADFDQIICECYDPRQGPNSGWLHVSLKPPGGGVNRRKCLSYVFDPDSAKLVYVEGLQADTRLA